MAKLQQVFCAAFLWAFCASPFAWAQMQQVKNVEIEIKPFVAQTITIPADSLGVLIAQKLNESKPSNDPQFVVTRYDRHLNKQWQVQFTVNRKLDLVQYRYKDQYLYLVFGGYSAESVRLVHINLLNAQSESTDFYATPKVFYHDMEVVDGKIFLAGALDDTSLLFFLDPKTKRNRLLNTAIRSEAKSAIKNIERNPETGNIDVTIASETYKNQQVVIRSFDTFGEKSNEIALQIDPQLRVLEAKTVANRQGKAFIVGTYGQPNLSRAQGIFLLAIADQSVTYHAFDKMDEFISTPKSQKPNPQSLVKNAKAAKVSQPYFVALNDIVVKDDQLVVFTETYDLVYAKNQGNGVILTDPYHTFGKVWANNNMNFYQIRMDQFTEKLSAMAGYDLKQSNLISFNWEGQRLWDEQLDLTGAAVSKQFKRYKVTSTEQGLALVNNQNGEVHTYDLQSRTLVAGNVVNADKDGNIQQGVPVKQVVNALPWYSNYILNISVVGSQGTAERKPQVIRLSKLQG